MSPSRKLSHTHTTDSASPQQTSRPQYGLLVLGLLGTGYLFTQLSATQGLLLLLGVGLGLACFTPVLALVQLSVSF